MFFPYLSGKRRTLSDAELEGFKKLGECFNLTQTMNVNTGGGNEYTLSAASNDVIAEAIIY